MQIKIKDNFIFYCIAIALCIITYYVLNNNMQASLLPHKITMELLYNFRFSFIPNLGYAQSEGLFVISQNCLGSKLFISLFLILIFGFLNEFKTIKSKIIALATFYFSSVIIAFIATIIRISASIPFCTYRQFTLIHNIISLFIYFMVGFVVYFVMEKRRILI